MKHAGTIFALACAAIAVAVPDWKQPLHASYAKPKYTITNAVVKQQLNVAGCKSLKTATEGDITLFDDGSYVMYRDDWSSSVLQGKWDIVSSKKGNTFYLSVNKANLAGMLNEFDADALPNCQTKAPGMTFVNTIDPTVLVSKNLIAVKVKNSAAKGTLKLKGMQQNDSKVPPVVGNVSAKVTLQGTLVGPLP